MKKLCVLLPAYNEAEHIGELVRRIHRLSVPGLDITPLVVNDGSRDATAAVAGEAGATVLSHPVNRGVGAAFRTGLEHARSGSCDFLVHMDADGQVNPDDIPKLMAPLLAGEADLALASRFSRAYPSNLKPWKAHSLRLLTAVVRLLTGARVTDISCGFRAMNRRVMEELRPHFDYDYIQESLIQALAARAKTVNVAVSIHYGDESTGMSRRPLRYISRFLLITSYALAQFYARRLREAFGPAGPPRAA